MGWHLPTIVNLTASYRQQKRDAEAEALLNKALKRFKYEATIYYLLAEMSEERREFKQAEKLYKKGLRQDPLNGFSHIRYARFLAKQNRLKLALKHADRATSLLPKCASCLTIRGDIQVKTKDHTDALDSYQKSLAIDPNAATRQKLIHALHKAGQHDRANRMQRALDAWLKHQAS